MNLDYMRNAEEVIMEGVKFCGQYPQCDTLDQDILNYLFSKNYLKLPERFDVFVGIERRRGQFQIRKAVYHYGGSPFGAGMGMDTSDVFNRLWMDYFLKSPWFDSSSIGRLFDKIKNLNDEHKSLTVNVSAAISGKTRGFITIEKYIDPLIENFSVRNDEEIFLVENSIPVQNIIDALNASRGEKFFFILIPHFPFNALTAAGFVDGKDFLNGFEFLSGTNKATLNPYPFISAM